MVLVVEADEKTSTCLTNSLNAIISVPQIRP